MGWIIALLRLPRTGWIIGRAGVLGHIARIDLMPNWLKQILAIINFVIAGRSAKKDAGQALCDALLSIICERRRSSNHSSGHMIRQQTKRPRQHGFVYLQRECV
tara:strand:- start:63 stop:374 length:312 start_codon:yes stop_codon:yes gene_type:complete